MTAETVGADPTVAFRLTPFTPEGATHPTLARYPELFWLPIVGPSAFCVLRRAVIELDDAGVAHGRHLAVLTSNFSSSLGLSSKMDTRGPFWRAWERLERFHLAQRRDVDEWAIAVAVPVVPQRYLRNCHPAIRADHDDWIGQ